MSTRHPQINIRVPEHVKAGLHGAAELSGRSVNSEIVFRLEQSFGKMPVDKLIHADEVRARARSFAINEVEEKLVALIAQKINNAAIDGSGEAVISVDDFQPNTDEESLLNEFISTINRICETLRKLDYFVEFKPAKASIDSNRIVIMF